MAQFFQGCRWIFDHAENLVTERIYFDQLTVLKELLDGPDKKNAKNMLTLLHAMIGAFALSGRGPDPRLTNSVEPDLCN